MRQRSKGAPTRWRIAIGADHGGFDMKAALTRFLQAKEYEVADLGTHSPEPCDYPRVAYKVASAVAQRRFDRGVLLCRSGIGIAIAANKVPGIRAGVCADLSDAERSRAHNDANILVLGAEKISQIMARRIIEVWLSTPFESEGRHARRVRQITAIERTVATTTQRERSTPQGARPRRRGLPMGVSPRGASR